MRLPPASRPRLRYLAGDQLASDPAAGADGGGLPDRGRAAGAAAPDRQRRVKHRAFHLIIVLCAVYAGVALVHGLLKLVLNVYRGWVAEYVTRDLRKRAS